MTERLELDGDDFRLGWYFLGWGLLLIAIGLVAFAGVGVVLAGSRVVAGVLASNRVVATAEIARILWAARFFIEPAALLALVAWPWAIVAFVRWFVGQVKTDKGAALAFIGRVSWAFFAALVGFTVIDIAVTVAHLMILTLLFDYVVRSVVIWFLLVWLLNHTTVGGIPLRLDYGRALAFTWRYVVTALSVITVVGWIWAGPWLMRWMSQQVNSEYGKFSYALPPASSSSTPKDAAR